VLKSQDIVVLLKLALVDPGWTLHDVARDLDLSVSAVHRSLNRLAESGLFNQGKRRINAPQAHEFLSHGLRYVFPAEFRGEARGIPTAWAAEPLAGRLAPSNSPPPVWPHPLGKQRGLALTPLHPSVPASAERDPRLAERLALVDAIRAGDARLRGVASKELRQRL
jgi:hypothetical protein